MDEAAPSVRRCRPQPGAELSPNRAVQRAAGAYRIRVLVGRGPE